MPLEPAIISQLVWIPYRYYRPEDAQRVMAELQVRPLGYEGAVREPIKYWRKNDARRLVGLPMEYGLLELDRLGIPEDMIVEDVSSGFEVSFPKRPTPRNEAQAAFFRDVVQSLRDNYAIMATAPTGTGKTVCVLNAAAELKRSTLIIVDTVVIAAQWRDEIKKHLGLAESEIGTVQGSTVDYLGKKITVAIIHNLSQKQWRTEFFRNFGFVAWDEGQILGAESFSQTMGQFPARHRITVTATPNRRDGCSKMIFDYFGQPRVVAQQTALPCEIRVMTYSGKRFNGNIPTANMLTLLSLDEGRNRLIVETILREWSEHRDMLCVSDRIEHLQFLMEWCAASGIPRIEMGLFTRSYVDEEAKEQENKAPYLDWCKREAKVIFATYQMFEKAVDVPRLSSGIDATPRASATQMIGRIRRTFDGKPEPRWWTIIDSNNKKFASRFKGRLRDYQSDPLIRVTYL